MGSCCNNEEREKNLDTKEAHLENLFKSSEVNEKGGKHLSLGLSAQDEDYIFESEVKKLRSKSIKVNVFFYHV